MKKQIAMLLIFSMVFMVAGCLSPAPEDAQSTTLSTSLESSTAPSETVSTVFPAPLSAISLPLVHEAELADDGTNLFTYTYQTVRAILQDAGIADQVVLDLLNRIDSTRAYSDAILSVVRGDYALADSWIPYFYKTIYSPTRIDQVILSLRGSQMSFNGNPHPSHYAMSATYDLSTGKALTFGDILDPNFSAQRLQELVAAALEDRADQLYPYYRDILSDLFTDDCGNLEAWYLSWKGLCLYFPPYDLAPYSVGTVVAEIPYDALNGIVKAIYLPAQLPAATGTVEVTPLQDADQSEFTQFAELVLDKEATPLLLHTDGTVYEVTISLSDENSPEEEIILFAADHLSQGDGVMIRANLTQPGVTLRLRYIGIDGQVSSVIVSPLSPQG